MDVEKVLLVRKEVDDSFVVSGTRNSTQTAMMTPAKFGEKERFLGSFILKGGFDGHGRGENEVMGQSRSRDTDGTIGR